MIRPAQCVCVIGATIARNIDCPRRLRSAPLPLFVLFDSSSGNSAGRVRTAASASVQLQRHSASDGQPLTINEPQPTSRAQCACASQSAGGRPYAWSGAGAGVASWVRRRRRRGCDASLAARAQSSIHVLSGARARRPERRCLPVLNNWRSACMLSQLAWVRRRRRRRRRGFRCGRGAADRLVSASF
jgi:hypothetical protein